MQSIHFLNIKVLKGRRDFLGFPNLVTCDDPYSDWSLDILLKGEAPSIDIYSFQVCSLALKPNCPLHFKILQQPSGELT